MDKPENGLYMARVTDEGATMMHADEDAMFDHETSKIFRDRDKNRNDQVKDTRT